MLGESRVPSRAGDISSPGSAFCAARTVMLQRGGPPEDHNCHPNHRTDRLRQNHARTQTPSTGLRHPSLEEDAGKRCSERGSNAEAEEFPC